MVSVYFPMSFSLITVQAQDSSVPCKSSAYVKIIYSYQYLWITNYFVLATLMKIFQSKVSLKNKFSVFNDDKHDTTRKT